MNTLNQYYHYLNLRHIWELIYSIIYNGSESETPLLCCDCWRFTIPVNCLTVSLFTNLVLIVFFTIIKFYFIDPKKTSKNTSSLIEEIIVILLFSAVVVLIAILVRYICKEKRRQQIISFLTCRRSGSELEEENRRVHLNIFNNYYSHKCNEQLV